MQVGPHRLLSFLPGSTQPPAAQAGDKDSTAATAAAGSGSSAALRETTAAQEDAGVILHIQPETPAAADTQPLELVYSKVRKSASPEEIKVQQFVHFAVSAMREYADAQDRLKTAASSQEDSAPGASLIPRSLAEVQKLAARFRLFA